MVLLARVGRILTRARSWYHAHACASCASFRASAELWRFSKVAATLDACSRTKDDFFLIVDCR